MIAYSHRTLISTLGTAISRLESYAGEVTSHSAASFAGRYADMWPTPHGEKLNDTAARESASIVDGAAMRAMRISKASARLLGKACNGRP